MGCAVSVGALKSLRYEVIYSSKGLECSTLSYTELLSKFTKLNKQLSSCLPLFTFSNSCRILSNEQYQRFCTGHCCQFSLNTLFGSSVNWGLLFSRHYWTLMMISKAKNSIFWCVSGVEPMNLRVGRCLPQTPVKVATVSCNFSALIRTSQKCPNIWYLSKDHMTFDIWNVAKAK